MLNAASGVGQAEKIRGRVEELFAAAGRPVHVTLASSGDELLQAVDAAKAEGAVTIVAGGGDGTVSTVANALVDTDTVLGILPLGTLNHFAKDAGIPLDLDEAIAVILAGHTTRVDAGEVNGRCFLNNSSLGIYPRMVRLRQRYPARGLKKWVVALWALFKTLERNPSVTVRIEAEGERLVYRTPVVFVGNNEYTMAGLEAGTRASLLGGRLAIYVLKSGGRPRVMRLAWRMFTGQVMRSGELDLLLVEAATIEFRHSAVPVATDGEVQALETPLEYRSRPASLSVLVPKLPEPA